MTKQNLERRRMMTMLSSRGITYRIIGKMFNVTHQRVQQIISGYNSKHYKKDILQRDNYQCQLCFNKKDVRVHHLNRDRKCNKLYNLLTLCYECHRKLHSGLL